MTAFEQSVRVGDQDRVHIRSATKRNQTRCGLQEQAPLLLFQETTVEPTCVYCTHPAGRIANKREVLEHLRGCAEQAHRDQDAHPCDFHEIEMHRADQRVADYIDAHPELAA